MFRRRGVLVLLVSLLLGAGCAGDGAAVDRDASGDAGRADAGQPGDARTDAAPPGDGRPTDDDAAAAPDALDRDVPRLDGWVADVPDVPDPTDAPEPSDAGPDSGPDSWSDVASDALSDAWPDSWSDAWSDSWSDSSPDSWSDVPADAPTDSLSDAEPDVAPDADPDAEPDAARDAGPDGAPSDAGPDTADAAPDTAPDAGAPPAECPAGYAAPVETGRLDTAELDEASGIAYSRRTAGVLWLHNDSGDSARLFAVQEDGRVVATLALEGVSPRDFEDLSAAPCPDGHETCLWVGDIGNNGHNRTNLKVYILREPALPPPGSPVAALSAPPDWTLPCTYPAASIDSEGLAVAADGATFYVFEKADREAVSVLTHPGPLTHGVEVALVPLTTVSVPQWTGGGRLITGADIHPGGGRLLLRTYAGTAEWRFGPGEGMADLGALVGTVVARGPSAEGQGEAACYDATGLGFWTVSEKAGGFQPLHFYPCL